ncbi:MAG: alpha-L-rhamnosidase C-terminal domain-containing protein [Chitinophagaceae bacterium]
MNSKFIFKLVLFFFLFKFSLFTTPSFSQSTSSLLTDKLTCEYIQNPLGIDTKSPRLSWTLTSKERDQVQTSYELIVSDNLNDINHCDAFARQIIFLQSTAVEGLFHWDISDHEALDPTPEAFTAASFYYHPVLGATEFAGILGKKADSLKYDRLARQIENAFTQKYLVPTTGRFDNATQSAPLFVLWYEFSPEKNKTFDVLLEEFARHDWHLSTGIFSTKMMFDVLRENNRNDVAFRVANQRDYPGWGNMPANGATTLWKTWKYPESCPSQNHPMFGSINEWFYRSLPGINSAAPGFKKIIIKPQPEKEITWAKGRYESVYGTITCDWKTTGNDFILKIIIPANSTAEIWLPATQKESITESKKAVTASRYENGYAVVNIETIFV